MTDFAVRPGLTGLQSSDNILTVTPADGADIAFTSRAIYVGGAGDLTIITPKNQTVTFSAVPAGTLLPICANRIKSTGTTATLILAIL